MNRTDALQLAGKVAETLKAAQEAGRETSGIVHVTLMLADTVAAGGHISDRVWLKACGIIPGRKRGRRIELNADEAYRAYREGAQQEFLRDEGDEGGEATVTRLSRVP